MNNVLISIKPKYVSRMLKGEKSIEIRRRSINLPDGANLWIYATLPVGSIFAVAVVEYILCDNPSKIWSKFASHIGVDEGEYVNYVKNCNKVSAIKLKSINKIEPTLPLSWLKTQIKGFHPPQFIAKLNKNNPLLKYLTNNTTHSQIKDY